MDEPEAPCANNTQRQIILCFDGTGNTIRSDGTNTNIAKIFRMLEREKEGQYCYYQPGIGTNVSFTNQIILHRRKSTTQKALDQALAGTFDEHVMGGYRFLMRRYQPGARIYLFGFSRGAFTARFLNEMLDYMGLLHVDNEELIPHVWEAFSAWNFCPRHDRQGLHEAYAFLKLCRETMCRPVDRVRFLGLFDTVNSVAEFKVERNLVPSARVIRHAVSIDERRIKFQPVLLAVKLRRWRVWEDYDDEDVDQADDEAPSSIQEVYFAGDHSDVGGGWKMDEGQRPVSDVPLNWMVNEAMKAGLTFNRDRLREFGCESCEKENEIISKVPEYVQLAELHDPLAYESGTGVMTFFWRFLELLPFKRLHTLPDGSQKVSRRPVIGGMPRYIAKDAKVHGSVIRRLRADQSYRPANLVPGGWIKKKVKKLRHVDIGEWVCVRDEGGLGEYWVRQEVAEQVK